LAVREVTGPAALEAAYLSTRSILAQSDMVAVLGYQIAREFRNSYPIEIKERLSSPPEVRSIAGSTILRGTAGCARSSPKSQEEGVPGIGLVVSFQ
jgi:hypothetical protein